LLIKGVIYYEEIHDDRGGKDTGCSPANHDSLGSQGLD